MKSESRHNYLILSANESLAIVMPQPKNMHIFTKFVVQKCSLSIFLSICQADSENVMDNSVSAWTSKGRWYTGKKIRQNFQIWT